VSAADGVGAITLANATSGPDISGIGLDLVRIVTDNEPRLPDRWQPLPEVDQALLALTGPWYWGPRAYVLRLIADRAWSSARRRAGAAPPSSGPNPTAPGPAWTATTPARPSAWSAAPTAPWIISTWARSSSPGSPTARTDRWPPARTPRAGECS